MSAVWSAALQRRVGGLGSAASPGLVRSVRPGTRQRAAALQTLLLALSIGLAASSALAQESPLTLGERPAVLPPAFLADVEIDQRLGAQIPRGIALSDETGKSVRIEDVTGDKPSVLVFVYYGCPTICNATLNGLAKALRALSLRMEKDFRIVAVSFDPRETAELASKKRREYVRSFPEAEQAGWRFLTGNEASVGALAKAAGFKYRWDEKTKQYIHAAGLMVLTPELQLSRYLFGVEYSARDLRLSLVEASGGKIGSLTDAFLLYCFQYDPTQGNYTLALMNVTRGAGMLFVLGVGTWIAVHLRRERRARKFVVASQALEKAP